MGVNLTVNGTTWQGDLDTRTTVLDALPPSTGI